MVLLPVCWENNSLQLSLLITEPGSHCSLGTSLCPHACSWCWAGSWIVRDGWWPLSTPSLPASRTASAIHSLYHPRRIPWKLYSHASPLLGKVLCGSPPPLFKAFSDVNPPSICSPRPAPPATYTGVPSYVLTLPCTLAHVTASIYYYIPAFHKCEAFDPSLKSS